ncbi:CinA family nicotinamide mononucleotide deamidase-related protein [Meiothermus ruber]|jgi:nicotinamide-nucleotide amidase|uniref:CinA-like protein n=1 Tax=Meiothermus ruber (strain ATCC 35948 / DSM 1279 / VKM B-1258 / 21) TaxID=504728 RepID=D3PPA4_MEIRD|nr:CinA family nicotinamide mononucleotide deamidase-related protein [Meiothermus ruber]ADD27513.1 competence/damage-inducible protein CinA [Meiothermus ruber DSM 1279]AGK03977.1 competence/damage-inducible protein CinA [Meiothermus ruber DSM 1279]MCL6530631.1 CinA family nicotinamide mononucleotide deamidase-related protein [Meiothermus ruber]MCX7801711.1 CinA family nicotinamide mononucleotide deamidase-related protein [Meiothermus ruber]GAO74441.1 competence/damage-inducible protein CinA [M
MFLAEIIGVGDELLYGETVDTNTAEIAVSLQPYALEIRRTLRVADHLEALTEAVREAWQKARLVVLSGGLGPTPDDITREAIAAALGERMEIDPQVLAWLEGIFADRGWKMPQANRKQALKIPSATWIANPRGTAPGWWVHREGKDLVSLPGPPAEWRPMWAELLPRLGLPAKPYRQVAFKTFGLGESRIVELLGDLFQRNGAVEVGTYAKMDGVAVVVRGEPGPVEALAAQIRPLLGEAVWGQEGDTLPALALQLLEGRKATLATLESMTGGVLGALLTGIPGASRNYLGGLVSYSLEAKSQLPIPLEVAAQHGVVSAAFAEAMAVAARGLLGATYGLSTTGVAGPETLEGQPVGTLFVGLAGPEGVRSRHFRLPGASREMIRQRAAHAALAFLVSELR